MANEIENLLPLIEILQSKQGNLNEYREALKMTENIRVPIYNYVARLAIDSSLISEMIVKVNWDLADIMSEHNAYVDKLLVQIKQLRVDFDALKDRIPLDKCYLENIYRQCFRMCMKMLVDGYSSIKKCSNEGRALMQLDFQQLIVKLETLTEQRPLPDKEFVDSYIKAYYLPDSSIEKWIKEHPVSF